MQSILLLQDKIKGSLVWGYKVVVGMRVVNYVVDFSIVGCKFQYLTSCNRIGALV